MSKRLNGRTIIFLVVIVVIAAVGIVLRVMDSSSLANNTEEQAIPTVGVIKPNKSNANEEVVLPGTVQAWHEAPIYARTSGYLKSWKTDIGTKVKAGDLLATIETPEIDAQMHQAQADLATAQANSQLAQTTAARWKELLKTDSVSKQEADEKISDAASKAALVASAKANLQRLQETQSFKKVTAPFDGTITARNTDTGALINAGSGAGNGPELFHIADTTKLRIYTQVPQNYTAAIKPDMTAELHFAEHPGNVYLAKLVKTSEALDPVSRTLLAQFEEDNTSGELLAGGYTEVHLKLDTHAETLRLPVNTLMFRSKNMQVAIVGPDGKVQLKTISLGRDFGTEVEVTSGLSADDQIIVNPPDSLQAGQKVKIAEPEHPVIKPVEKK